MGKKLNKSVMKNLTIKESQTPPTGGLFFNQFSVFGQEKC
jgi:hypothetical protein